MTTKHFLGDMMKKIELSDEQIEVVRDGLKRKKSSDHLSVIYDGDIMSPQTKEELIREIHVNEEVQKIIEQAD